MNTQLQIEALVILAKHKAEIETAKVFSCPCDGLPCQLPNCLMEQTCIIRLVKENQ